MTRARSMRRRALRSRDRHGRGLRGPLYPPGVPAASSRSQRFDTLVLEAFEPIEGRWHTQLTGLDIAVDEVPDLDAPTGGSVELDANVVTDRDVPLARLVPAGVDRRGAPTRARIVLYRHPLEARAADTADLTELVHEVLVEQVATYLGVDPDTIDGGG